MIPIDIVILCEAIDYLCGSIILVRFNYYPHRVTLPRSWFITLLRRLKRDIQVVDTKLVNFLVGSIGHLLDRLASGQKTGWCSDSSNETSSHVVSKKLTCCLIRPISTTFRQCAMCF